MIRIPTQVVLYVTHHELYWGGGIVAWHEASVVRSFSLTVSQTLQSYLWECWAGEKAAINVSVLEVLMVWSSDDVMLEVTAGQLNYRDYGDGGDDANECCLFFYAVGDNGARLVRYMILIDNLDIKKIIPSFIV